MKDMNKYVMPQTEVEMMETSLLIMQQVSGSNGTIQGTGEPIIDPENSGQPN